MFGCLMSSFLKGAKKSKNKQSQFNQNSFQDELDEDYSDGEMFGQEYRGRREALPGAPNKLFCEKQDLNDKLVGVVITIYQDSSYDEMFRTVQPSSVAGERISTYAIACSDAQQLHAFLNAPMPIPEAWQTLVEDISKVDADSVVFNWECCSACGDHCFPDCEGNTGPSVPGTEDSATMRLMGLALQRGHTVMCSDFSLKSLIFEWSENILGPNPFIKVGSHDCSFKLDFNPDDLQQEEVPQQLQVVGELCKEHGSATVNAMGNTILYTVNPDREQTDLYTLKVLTVASSNDSDILVQHPLCSVGDGSDMKWGLAGHVTLTYKSGGQLVTSMGHWIELVRVHTTVEDVFRVCQKNYGEVEISDLRVELACLSSDQDREECLQKRSRSLIQKSMPSKMKNRTKFS